MARVMVIGAGAMGLAAAYHAVKAGHEVALFEAGPEPGGMAAHIDFNAPTCGPSSTTSSTATRPPSDCSEQ